MEQVTLNQIHKEILALKNELEKMRLVVEEDFEIADDVIEEIEESRSREEDEFISHEKMREEFG